MITHVYDDLISCPFCKEHGFDMVGLKHHIMNGWCESYEDLEVL